MFVILIPRGILLRRLPIEPVLAYHWGRSFDSGSMLTQARLICLTAQMCLTPAKTNATAIPCSMLSPRGPRGQELAKSTGISTACSQVPTERSPARVRKPPLSPRTARLYRSARPGEEIALLSKHPTFDSYPIWLDDWLPDFSGSPT